MAWKQDSPLATFLSQIEMQLQWKPSQLQCFASLPACNTFWWLLDYEVFTLKLEGKIQISLV